MATTKEIKKSEVQLNFKIPEDMHEILRKISFETRISIAQLCREGIEIIIKKYEKSSRK